MCNICNGGQGASGAVRTPEHKEAIGKARRGIPTTESAKLLMAKQGHAIICSNGMSFVSARRAAKWVRENTRHSKASYDTILDVCKGIRTDAYGLLWSYPDR